MKFPIIRVRLFSKDARLLSVLSSTLGGEFHVSLAASLSRAKSLVDEDSVDVWILDADCDSDAAGDWCHLAEEIHAAQRAQFIVMSTDEQRDTAMRTAEEYGCGWVRKPPAVRELKQRLKAASEACAAKRQARSGSAVQEPGRGLDQMTGSSAAMLAVYDLVKRVSKLEASVLITGESGTGKELVARAIHNMGSRAARPFVAISCGAIPESLIESELFGHEKGAFTGAAGTREGYLEQAGDGTLFLDEIGELSQNTQVKLLRVLQQKEFFRLGSSRPIPLRARVVFATHRCLSDMVSTGRFRQDLFYRVNVMNIHVPCLRDRAEDVPSLAKVFLHRYAELYGKQIDGFEASTLNLLQQYTWPGNVRELENAVQHAIVMAEGSSISRDDLPSSLQEIVVDDFEADVREGSFERQLREYKLKLVRDAIVQCNGNKTLAANSLSISRAYLHRLIRPVGASLEEMGAPVLGTESDVLVMRAAQ